MQKSFRKVPHGIILRAIIMDNIKPESKYQIIKERCEYISVDAIKELTKESNNDLKNALIDCPEGIYRTVGWRISINFTSDFPLSICNEKMIQSLHSLLNDPKILNQIKEIMKGTPEEDEIVIPTSTELPLKRPLYALSIVNGKLTGILRQEECDMYETALNVITTYSFLTCLIAEKLKLKPVGLNYMVSKPYIHASDIEKIQQQLTAEEITMNFTPISVNNSNFGIDKNKIKVYKNPYLAFQKTDDYYIA
jgi:hypothetical protein